MRKTLMWALWLNRFIGILLPFKKSSGYNWKIINLKGIELFTWGFGSNDLEIIMSGLRNGDLLLPPDSVTVLYEGVRRIKISF